MRAIILTAGQSSRFYPFGIKTHKTMIKIMGKPLLEYTLEGLEKIGIKDIVLIVRNDGEIESYFGNGHKMGLDIKYVVQKEPTGMGDALLLTREYTEEKFIFMGGNHVNSQNLIEELLDFAGGSNKALLAKERENPWEYGVVVIKNGKLEEVVEKPSKENLPSKFCLASVYLLTSDFLQVLETIEPSHYSFEEALGKWAKETDIPVKVTDKEILTLKYPWDILNIKNYLFSSLKRDIDKTADISKDAQITGEVVISKNARIMDGVKIKGPAFIGENVVIGTNALIRDGSDIEKDVKIGAFMEVKNSLLGEKSTTHSGFIGDSVIGEGCKMGGDFSTANVRLDREPVSVTVKDKKIDTGKKHLGAFIGDSVKIGIKTTTMPGVCIGSGATIGASTTVLRNVASGSTYYTKFQEVVEKPAEE